MKTAKQRRELFREFLHPTATLSLFKEEDKQMRYILLLISVALLTFCLFSCFNHLIDLGIKEPQGIKIRKQIDKINSPLPTVKDETTKRKVK